MKGILLLNGQPYGGEIKSENAFVVCCDGAYNWARGRVRIDRNTGDFDSVSKGIEILPPPVEIYPSEKDCTDGEIGLWTLLSHGCDEIEIYGAVGGRADHFLGNLHLLYYAFAQGVKAKIVAETADIFIRSGRVELSGLAGKTVSLLPFGGAAHIVNGDGFKYALNDKTFSYGSNLGISNIILKENAWFHCDRGAVLVFVNKNEV